VARALVIGGTRRVGRWVSEALLIEGHSVHAAYRSRGTDAQQCVDELARAGYTLTTVQADAADAGQIAQAISASAQELGGLDILVYAPGASLHEKLLATDAQSARRLVESNALGLHHCVLAAVPYLRLDGGGSIISFLSVSNDTPRAFRDMPMYAAAKAMQASYSRSLARELAGDHITVNAIALGITQLPAEGAAEYGADRLPSGRAVSQEDVAAAVWYLTGPASRQLTGSVLNLSGGFGL
jgi:NAD(P)-dependent dehydrogenase (short-subunit alcohol dehydrogenase family)